jgi:aspartate racemase
MKTIGLIGGVSWESTKEYYRIINETVRHRMGKSHSAEILLYSLDFQVIRDSNWQQICKLLTNKAILLEKAGADCILICANTLHKVYNEVQDSVSIPILHIADPLGKAIKQEGFHKVGLLGTKTTMEEDFYQKRLKEKFYIDVLIPPKEEREMVHKIIFNELVTGKIKKYSRGIYYSIMYELIEQGAEGIILGCTEIPLLIKQKDVRIPLFDTAQLHAEAAVEFALDE